LKSDDPNVLEGANAGLGCAYEMNKQMEKHLSIIQKQANMQLMMKIKQGICFFSYMLRTIKEDRPCKRRLYESYKFKSELGVFGHS